MELAMQKAINKKVVNAASHEGYLENLKHSGMITKYKQRYVVLEGE